MWHQKNTLQKHDHYLLQHHQQANPGNQTSNPVRNTFKQSKHPPHKLPTEYTDRNHNKKNIKNNEEKFDRAAIINEPNQRLGIAPVGPGSQMGQRIDKVIKAQPHLREEPNNPTHR